jgi:carbon storage regulator CsrA
MLMLSRKAGEAVFVGKLKVQVVEIKRGLVRLGFEGPDDVKVWREELLGDQRSEVREAVA